MQVSQNTPEWHELRSHSLGASDAAPIMGESPWKTNFRLWEEKVGLVNADQPTSSSMQRGIDLEPIVRSKLAQHLGCPLEPLVGRHCAIPWMMASFDAFNIEHGIQAEIKCPHRNRKDHEFAIEGKVPLKYYAQLQHQMLVSGLPMCYYVSYYPDSDLEAFVCFPVMADVIYQKKLLEEERTFWDCIQTMTPPTLKAQVDAFIDRESLWEWRHQAEEYKDLMRQKKHIDDRIEKTRNALIELSEGLHSRGAGIKLSRYVIPGRVNNEQIYNDYNVDISKYRQPSADAWRITVEK